VPVQQSPWRSAIDPSGASVFDLPGQGLLRKVVGLLGLDDPNNLLAIGTPMETGASTGGLLDAVAQKFPRFANAIKAYHGSPHDFDQFKTSAIGTGEGAQAYGHGLYFAENPQVAADYRNSLAHPTAENPAWRLNGAPVAPGTDHWQLASALENGGKPASGQSMRDYLENLAAAQEDQARFADKAYGEGTGTMYRVKADMLRKVDPSKLTFQQPGRTYEVGINAHPDQFLDWDKPLSQQHPDVQKAVKPLLVDAPNGYYDRVTDHNLGKDPTGAALYHAAQNHREMLFQRQRVTPAGAEGASDYFASKGIPGIKYLDQGSRAAGEGSRNFVVFDDKTVDILRKYGVLPPIVGAALANQSQKE
jgi:hypothetical protein